MPRQDVPYGGALCRLKERIAEIWDELGKKLHSINGVEGDAAGDVKIVSGDPAVVITDDQLQHQIEVSLDTSQLPAASVASVNGQTGAVTLDAGDIPSDGNSNVQTDIDVNKAAISACSSAITSEQLARQNADSTLQTNINTLSASLPSAAAAAVAADPTVAQLVTDMAGKVDLTDVSTVETPDTIAKRNGSGRLVAADPASGATDKTLTTANWISQTGSGRPNNLIHDGGSEDVNGLKRFVDPLTVKNARTFNIVAGNGVRYWKIATLTNLSSYRYYALTLLVARNNLMSMVGVSGQLNAGTYTAVTSVLANGTIGNQAYIGIGTVDNESCLILRTARQVTVSGLILSYVSGPNDSPDRYVIVTPSQITVPADYIEGVAVL